VGETAGHIHLRSAGMTMEHLILKTRRYAGNGLVTIEEVASYVAAPKSMLERMIEEEIVRPQELREGTPLFAAEEVSLIERLLHLHEDLGVNWAGVAIIKDLQERVRELQQELERRTHSSGDTTDAQCD
jgi:hypothetical protein